MYRPPQLESSDYDEQDEFKHYTGTAKPPRANERRR
jgi:hypothetical protein